jgi:SAM-dependent methyltransferase
MTLNIAVVGIDGSGKSTLAPALPMALSAECGVVAGAAGDEYWVFGPDQDHMAPGFHPSGLPHAARIARLCQRLSRRVTANPRLYPYVKLAHLMFQDDAALSVARRYGCDVMVSDSNLVLSATGRGSNYKSGATHSGAARERSRVKDLEAMFAYLLEGTPMPEENARRLPSLEAAGFVARLARILGFDGVWLPDVVIFLDVDPGVALERIDGRGAARDRHENIADMTRARESYLKALNALTAYRPSTTVCVLDVNGSEPRDVLAAAVAAVRPRIDRQRSGSGEGVLGTSGASTARRVASAGYLFRYLVPSFFAGAWREPFFLLTSMGRRLVREGYSAGVMTDIYDSGGQSSRLFGRIFLDYPLHRAVHDRLAILTSNIEPELTWRLEQHERVRIFTAPSGFAYDLFRPLETIARDRPELMHRVELIAADLDPHGRLEKPLRTRAERLGIDFHFVTGDLTSPEMRARLADFGQFDVALFVGLSSWLPRGDSMRHLRWLAKNLRHDGLLVSDCFSASAYSLGGRQLGYRAHYYSPPLYRSFLDYCGFDGASVEIESGRDRINHVLVAEPAHGSDRQAAPLQSLASHRCISGDSSPVAAPLPSTTV